MTLIVATDRTVPVTVQARSRLSPTDAFELICPIDLSLIFKGWHQIFPGVRAVEDQTGAWDHVGASRHPRLTDGSTALEKLAEYTPPHSFAYELTHFTNVLGRLVYGLRGEWTFTPDGDETLVRWTYEFKPRPGRHTLVRLILSPLWQRYMLAGVLASIDAAERMSAQVARQ